MKGVDAVVHSAGLVKARNEAEFFECNTQGTVNLLEAAIEHAPNLVRFVHVSSLEACGPSLDGKPVPLDQEQPGHRVRPLEARRREGGRRAQGQAPRRHPPSGGDLRTARRRDLRGLPAPCRSASTRSSATARCSACYTYGPDCARACIQAIDANVPSGNIYFVDDGASRSAWRARWASSSPRRSARAAPPLRHPVPGAPPRVVRRRGLRQGPRQGRDAHAREGDDAQAPLGLREPRRRRTTSAGSPR